VNTVNNGVAALFEAKHRESQEVSCSALDSGLKDTAADELVPAPLPGVSTLTMDGYALLNLTPWSQQVLDLGPLPTDESATG